MDTDALTSGTLQKLRATRPYPALSLTMPTHRRAPDNTQDAVRLRNLVAEAGHRLDADPRVSSEARDAVKAQLDRAAADIDPRRALESLVVLADADEYQIWQVPRTAPERVVLSDSYLTRNLVAAKAGARLFWVLSFSADHAALWSGTNESLRAVKDHGFPLSPPHQNFDPERQARSGDAPSIYTDEDTRTFFRTVDDTLRGVLAAEPRPLFLSWSVCRRLSPCSKTSATARGRPPARSRRGRRRRRRHPNWPGSWSRRWRTGASRVSRPSGTGWTPPVAPRPSRAGSTRCGRPPDRAASPSWRSRSTSSGRSG